MNATICNVTENVIARVETAILVGAPVEEIVESLAKDGIVGYDAFLAYKAAEVSVRMFEKWLDEYTAR